MEPVKRNIIVKEIEHWRRSKLLPEHYCDFLLNLYAEDAAAARPASRSPFRAFLSGTVNARKGIYGFTILTILAILALNFTAFPAPLQIVIAVVAIVGCYAAGWIWRERKQTASIAAFGLGALLTLLAGPLLLKLHEADTPGSIALYVAGCGVLWMILGLVMRLSMFHFCGWMCLSLVYAWLIYPKAETWPGWTVHALWIPVAMLIVALAWAIRRMTRRGSRVLLAVALLQWFIPDAMLIWISGTSAGVQATLIVKLLIVFVVYFALRGNWSKSDSEAHAEHAA